MNKPLRKYAVPLLAAGLLALTGCSSSGGSDSSGSSSIDQDRPSRFSVDETQPDPAATTDPESGAEDSSGSRAEQSPEDSGVGTNRTAPQTRAVISKGTVSLLSDDTDKARFDLQKVLDEHDGTIDEESTSTDDDGKVRRTRLVLRVPVQEFDAAMTKIASVAELTDSSRNTEDVTTQVIDNEARIRAQEKSLKRIELLLSRAQDLNDIVSIEAQLTSRQADLDSLKSQQAYLTDQTSMSTINVHIERKDPETAEKKDEDDDRNAFLAGLSAGWGALSAFGAGLAGFLGAVLPFAVVLALLGFPLVIGLRRLLRRRVNAAGEPARTPSTA